MAWVVDTCVLIDVLEDDPMFGLASALTLDEYETDGLIVCPISFAELAPAFEGDPGLQEEFLAGIGGGLSAGLVVGGHASRSRSLERVRSTPAVRSAAEETSRRHPDRRVRFPTSRADHSKPGRFREGVS